VALKAYEDGYRIIVEWFNKAFDAWKIDVRIQADPPSPDVTLDECRLRLSNALVGIRPYFPNLPSDDDLFPWVVGHLLTESKEPGDKLGGIGLRETSFPFCGSAEIVHEEVGLKHAKGWKDSQFRVYVVEPMEENAALWQEQLQQFLTKADADTRRLDGEQPDPTKLASDVAHSSDFRSVRWFGEQYSFTTMQAACVEVLWRNWEQGTPALSEITILDGAGSAGERLRDVFKKGKHPAWGTMITPAGKGAFQLAKSEKS
jgi:hypothetical protein